MFFVYVIQNKLRNKIYIGQTQNISNRIDRHNQQKPFKKSSYTYKNKGKWDLVYKEEFISREEAISREKELKTYQGRQYLKRIISGL